MDEDMIYPKFFIGGAQKCGTTSLAMWLNEHPDLECSNPKEPNFFANRALTEIHKDFSVFFSSNRKESSVLFEATTSYMTDLVARENITRILGSNTKFIFILKDPVKRAVSAYYHLFKHFAEKRDLDEVFSPVPSNVNDLYEHESYQIQKALKEKTIDITRYREKYDNYTWAYRYLSNGLYSRHVRSFQDVFGEDNILCINLDKIRSHPKQEFSKITRFLNIKDFETLPDTQSAYNRTKIPRYLYNKTIRQNNQLLSLARLSHKIYDRVLHGDHFTADPYPLDKHTEKSLRKLFAKEYEFLSSL